MRFKCWSELESGEDRQPSKKPGWEGKKVLTRKGRSPGPLCLPEPCGRLSTDPPPNQVIRLGPDVRSYSSAWVVQGRLGFYGGVQTGPMISPPGEIQGLSLGSFLGGDPPVFPVSNPEHDSEQEPIKCSVRWTNK